MDDYSLWADLLNKFHTSLPWVQMLWLLALPLLLFGLGWCIKEVLIAFARRKPDAKGELVYSIYRNRENELFVYSHTEALEGASASNMILLPATEKPKEIPEEPAKLLE